MSAKQQGEIESTHKLAVKRQSAAGWSASDDLDCHVTASSHTVVLAVTGISETYTKNFTITRQQLEYR